MDVRLALRRSLLVMACLVTADAAAPETEAPGTTPNREFDLTISGPASAALAFGDSIVLTARITPHHDYARADLELKPLGDLGKIYGPPADAATCTVEGPEAAKANVPFVAVCQLVGTAGRRFWRPAAWFLAPGVHHVALVIPITGESAKTTWYFEEVPVTFKAPLDAVFVGGLVGAFLLAMFIAVKDGAHVPVPVLAISSWAQTWRIAASLALWLLHLIPRIWRLLLQTVTGGICALILILLAQGTEGMNPPISIRIQDFWGGVVVGLFSIPLSRWLWTKLQDVSSISPHPFVPPVPSGSTKHGRSAATPERGSQSTSAVK